MHKLYVEPSDEITTVIERLKAAPESLVALIAPKGATLMQSIVNLKLARRAAQESGKTIVLVSTDKIGRNLAVQLGIPVASTEREVPEVLEGGSAEEEAAVIGGVRIHRYYEEEEKGSADAPASAVEPIIIPKKMVSAAPAAAPALVADQPAEESSAAGAEDLHEPAETAEPLETPADEAVAEPVIAPSINRSSFDPKPLTPPSDTSISRSQIEPRTSVPMTPSGRRKQNAIKFAIFCGALVLIAGGTISYLILPITEASVKIPAESWSKELSLTASTSTATASGTEIPATLLTAEATDSVTFKATGSKQVGETASGTLTLYNYDSTAPQTLPAGATVTAGGKQFTTKEAVSVPGYSQSIGKPRIPGTATVAIAATAAGASSNLSDASTADISGSGYSLSGKLTTSGGTDKTVTVVTSSDITAARAALSKKLGEAVKAKIAETTGSGTYSFDETADVVTVGELSSSAAVDEETAEAQVQGSATIKRTAVAIADTEAAAKALSAAETPAGFDRQVTAVTVSSFKVAQNGDAATLAVKAEGKESAPVDSGAIKKNLTGKSMAEAQQYVHDILPTATLQVKQKPRWWPFHAIPRSERYITVSVTYE